MSSIDSTLSYIGERLNAHNILWAVGASVLLKKHGLTDQTHDIDVFISLENIEEADRLLCSMGEKKPWEENRVYATKHFNEYVIQNMDIDVIAGFAIKHINGVYIYPFTQESITEYAVIQGVKIPFTSLEEWYVIYQMIPDREAKVQTIEKHLKINGIKNPNLLQKALKTEIPDHVKIRIMDLLQQSF